MLSTTYSATRSWKGRRMDADALVRDYLSRLDAAASALPAGRRAELGAEVHEHIETALSEAERRDEVTVRNVLERLGSPEEIVAAESSPGEAAGAPSASAGEHRAAASPWGAVEVIALLLLTLGSVFLPFVGPLIGLVFVWASNQWTRQEKLVATGIVALLLLPILIVVLSLMAFSVGATHGPAVMQSPVVMPQYGP